MFQFRSVISIVKHPASTGKLNNNKNAVIKIDQINKGIRVACIPRHLILYMVTIKFTAPAIEDTPAKCKLNAAASTAGPECATKLLNGG